MDRVFVDANVLFSAAYNPSRKVAKLWGLSEIEIITSPYAAAEAMRNIARKFPKQVADLSRLLAATGIVQEVPAAKLPANIKLSAKDVPILLAAIAAGATHLLTGDRDFDVHFGKTIAGVLIMRPAEFLAGYFDRK